MLLTRSSIPFTMRIMMLITLRCGLLALLMTLGLCSCNTIAPRDIQHRQSHNPLLVDQHGNLWQAMRYDLRFAKSQYLTAEVKQQIAWYQQHNAYLNVLITRAAPYLFYIYQQTQIRHLPADLALLPFIESEYNPFAFSKAGATGLWQFMPGTASGLRVQIDWWYDGRRNLMQSTEAALDYLTYLHEFLDDNWLLAIAAYNSGEGTVRSALRHNVLAHKPTDFWSLALPKETRSYVPKFLALVAIIRHPENYHMTLRPIANAPYLTLVPLKSQIDLVEAARLAQIDIHTLRQLNPGYRRWATDPNGPFSLLIPIAKADTLKRNLAALPKSNRVTWHQHTVVKGDVLSQLAKHYQTTVAVIRHINELKDNRIQLGQKLLIPQSYQDAPLKLRRQHGVIAEDRMPGPRRLIHTVIAGDTWASIAHHHHVSIAQLIFWNNRRARDPLQVQQTLIIWKKPPTLPRHTTRTYVVKAGDTLSKIGKTWTNVQRIKTLNHLKSDHIRIGQRLKVPH